MDNDHHYHSECKQGYRVYGSIILKYPTKGFNLTARFGLPIKLLRKLKQKLLDTFIYELGIITKGWIQ